MKKLNSTFQFFFEPVGGDVLFLAAVLFLMSAYYTHLGITSNDASRYSLTKAIVTNGTICVDGVLDKLLPEKLAVDKTVYRGKTYSDKAPLGSLLAVPACFIIHLVTDKEFLRIWFTTLFISALPFALSGVLLYLIALEEGFSRKVAWIMVFLFMSGSNLFYWSTIMFSHALTSFLILLACYIVKYVKRSFLSYMLAGFVAGLAVGSDYYMILVLVLLGLYVLINERKYLVPLIIGGAVAGFVPMVYHYMIFENPLILPYKHQAHFGESHAQGIYGISGFKLRSIWDLLFAPSYGLFLFNPFLFSIFYYGKKAFKKDSYFSTFVLISGGVLVLMVGSINQPSYALGYSWGPRYLVPIISLFAMLIIIGAGSKSDTGKNDIPKWVIILAVISFFFNWLMVNMYYPPSDFNAMSYLYSFAGKIILGTGGLSVLGQLRVMLHLNLNPFIVLVTNLLVSAIPFMLYFIRFRTSLKVAGSSGKGVEA